MTLDYRNQVSAATIAFYVPILLLAIYLLVRQGIHRNAGYVYMIMFSIARILGAALELGTINNPTSKSLNIGYAVLVSIGLSPLLLATLGILGRVLESVKKTKHVVLDEMFLYAVHIIVIIALVLSIVGINQLPQGAIFSGHYSQPKESIASIALFIVAYVMIVAVALYLGMHFSSARAEEKRLLIGVVVSLPFLLVRLIYSCVATLGNVHSFNAFTGNVTIFLCMALVMEYITVFIYEAVAITVGPFPKDAATAPHHKPQSPTSDSEIGGRPSDSGPHRTTEKQSGGAGSTLAKIGGYTIIGQAVMAIRNRRKR
ncbi:MAG: hypothetical protein M1828_004601 [Chrysothrix sp. TS-e1954]|nr:MAG: hypothetical protein M1828_004601 [Chrysothrix sp. TS-e1954]